MEEWNKRKRPICLERRFEFDDYQKTRDFLDRLGDYCEQLNRFPDISFGKVYVNITIRPVNDQATEINKEDYDFANEIGLLFE